MLIIYSDTFKSKLPVNIPNKVKYEDKTQIKNVLKEYYNSLENDNVIPLAIYDCELESGETLIDVCKRYIDFPFIELHVFEPLKPYQFNDINNFNAIFEMKNNSFQYAQEYADLTSNVYTHLTDNPSSYFLTFQVSDINAAIEGK